MKSLSDAALEAAAPHFEVITFQSGQCIIRQGERGQRFFIIEHGEVSVHTRMDDGTGKFVNKLVKKLGPQEFFGERSLLENVLTNATVSATQNTVCSALT